MHADKIYVAKNFTVSLPNMYFIICGFCT